MLEGTGPHIVSRITTESTVTLLLDLLCLGPGRLRPPVPGETRHRTSLKHGAAFKATGPRIVTHTVAVGTRVLALGRWGTARIIDQTRGHLKEETRALVVASHIAE
jgi:hypothetical protein